MNFDYAEFKEFDFAPRLNNYVGEVYILVLKVGGTEAPFYVGQTKRFLARMDDYFWGDFQAATDFKVSRAIHFFMNN